MDMKCSYTCIRSKRRYIRSKRRYSCHVGCELTGLWLLGLAVWVFLLVREMVAMGWTVGLWTKSLLALGTVVIALALSIIIRWYLGWLTIAGIDNLVPPVILRIWSLPGHPNFLAAMLNLLWPLALAQLIKDRGWIERLILILWTLAAWVVIFFTSSRGGWLGTAAAFVTLTALWVLEKGGVAWISRTWRSLRSRPLVLFGLAMGIVGLSVAALLVLWPQLSHPSHRPALESRQEFWGPAWDAFKSSPVVGVGPFTYEMEFNRAAMNSVPGKSIFTHAHSLYMTVLAEAGLLGSSVLLIAMLSLAWNLRARWRHIGAGRRAGIIGASAALSSAAVHGLFDTVQMMPTLAMLLAIVAAIELRRPADVQLHQSRPCTACWMGPILWLGLIMTAIWSLWGYAPAAEGVLAGNLDDWSEAILPLEEAVRRDANLGINHFHAAVAHGILAADDATHLEPAIAHYRAGIAHDPAYAPHHANLSALLWQAGRQTEAVTELQRAEMLAPKSPVFPLGLGVFYESMGDKEAAKDALERAAVLSYGESTFFWRSSSLRQDVIAGVIGDLPDAEDDGWSLLVEGDLAASRQMFATALDRSASAVEGNRGLAAVALAAGDVEAATHHLQVALFIGPTYNLLEHRRAQMDWARLAVLRGELDAAISRAKPVIDAYRRETFWGYGRYGTADYGWYVYYRESLLQDMLPQVVTAGLPDEAGDWMLEVAGWHRQLGDIEAAQDLCSRVLEEIPDSVAAAECLDELAD